MTRKRFTEREVLETAIRQGAVIRSYRSKEPFTLENVHEAEREHLVPVAMGGADDPANCAYSLRAEHKTRTFGTKATTAGSDIHALAKIKRILRGKRPSKHPMKSRKTAWPKRKWGAWR